MLSRLKLSAPPGGQVNASQLGGNRSRVGAAGDGITLAAPILDAPHHLLDAVAKCREAHSSLRGRVARRPQQYTTISSSCPSLRVMSSSIVRYGMEIAPGTWALSYASVGRVSRTTKPECPAMRSECTSEGSVSRASLPEK